MKYLKKLLFLHMFFLAQSIDASYYRSALIAVGKSSQYVRRVTDKAKDLIIAKAKNKYKNNETQNVVTTESNIRNQHAAPYIAQAAKNEAEQAATATGFLNFAKNSTTATNHHTYNYNYAPKTWVESFVTWVETGKQVRSVGTGFVFGGITGYGAHAVMMPAQKEKVILIQGQPEKN